MRGIEPPTSALRTQRSPILSYIPCRVNITLNNLQCLNIIVTSMP